MFRHVALQVGVAVVGEQFFFSIKILSLHFGKSIKQIVEALRAYARFGEILKRLATNLQQLPALLIQHLTANDCFAYPIG